MFLKLSTPTSPYNVKIHHFPCRRFIIITILSFIVIVDFIIIVVIINRS
jgi:hypothetical protein